MLVLDSYRALLTATTKNYQQFSSTGKQCFFVLRQQSSTVQGLAAVNEKTSKQMIKFVSNITKESIIDVEATIKCVPARIEACTQKDVELHVERIYVVSASRPQLPLQIEDAARPVNDNDDSGLNIKVNQDTRLDNRILDLRTPANQAIFRVEAAVCKLFRDILTEKVGCSYLIACSRKLSTSHPDLSLYRGPSWNFFWDTMQVLT